MVRFLCFSAFNGPGPNGTNTSLGAAFVPRYSVPHFQGHSRTLPPRLHAEVDGVGEAYAEQQFVISQDTIMNTIASTDTGIRIPNISPLAAHAKKKKKKKHGNT